MEIILASFLIQFCPGCGERFAMGAYARSDYLNHATVSCTCGVRVQYTRQDHMVQAATQSGGDLAETVRRYE